MPVAWLSTSASEIARVRALIREMSPGGVIDELGFLILQGAFADYFYPAVTTPMTRPRYLIFIPAIYRYVEQSGLARKKDVDHLVRDLQFALLQSLGDEDGAIGKEKGRKLVRTPAEIYWTALGTLGLARERVSELSYQRRLTEGRYSLRTARDDDGAVLAEDDDSLWDSLPRSAFRVEKGVFPEGTSLRLHRSEAAELLARYEKLRPHGTGGLIPHAVSITRRHGPKALDDAEHLWDVAELPFAMAHAAEHARRLSLFARGVTLQYHRMLIEKKRLDDPGVVDAFAGWWEVAQSDLAMWDLDDFFALINSWVINRRERWDRVFLRDWIQRLSTAPTAKWLLSDATAQRIITEREQRVRMGKERLRIAEQLRTWQPFPVYRPEERYQLAYRHHRGRRFAQDISAGLEGWPQ